MAFLAHQPAHLFPTDCRDPLSQAPGPAHLFLVRETAPEYGSPPSPGARRDSDAPSSDSFADSAAPSSDPFPDVGAPSSGPFTDAASPASDPFTDADALEALEEEVVVLAAHLHAATHRLLTLIAEYDRRRGWELGGHRSCAHWLSFRTGIDLGAAREKVRAARELEGLPLTSAAMARGELSFSQVRALTRVATAENEEDLVELALGCTTAQLERMVRAFRKGTREEEADLERIRHEGRSFSVFPGDDGMYVVKGRLTPEVGALLMRAVEAASDALFREEGDSPTSDSQTRAAQRRADALGLMAERAMEAGFREGPVSGTRAARFQVVLHVDENTLADPRPLTGNAPEPGRSELEDGTHVSAETSRRISCDCAVVRMVHGQDHSILDIGRRTRSIPPALRRALEVRDRGCRFPGCGSRFTDAHHVTHWADGGETSLTNTLLLCKHHHALVHEGGWRVDWWGEGRPVFFDPRGGTHFEGRWKPPEGVKDGSAETLVRNNRQRGVIPDGWTPSARWKREEDIPAEVLWKAVEAMGGG